MGIECGVHFLLNGSGQTIATDEDDGVQMVGFGACSRRCAGVN
jgi:hypothetical protein